MISASVLFSQPFNSIPAQIALRTITTKGIQRKTKTNRCTEINMWIYVFGTHFPIYDLYTKKKCLSFLENCAHRRNVNQNLSIQFLSFLEEKDPNNIPNNKNAWWLYTATKNQHYKLLAKKRDDDKQKCWWETIAFKVQQI